MGGIDGCGGDIVANSNIVNNAVCANKKMPCVFNTKDNCSYGHCMRWEFLGWLRAMAIRHTVGCCCAVVATAMGLMLDLLACTRVSAFSNTCYLINIARGFTVVGHGFWVCSSLGDSWEFPIHQLS